jgi:hypothetical protein
MFSAGARWSRQARNYLRLAVVLPKIAEGPSCARCYDRVTGVDRLLVGRTSRSHIPLLGEQQPEVERRRGGDVRVVGVDRVLVGRTSTLYVSLAFKQDPEVERCRGDKIVVTRVDRALEGRTGTVEIALLLKANSRD